MKKILFLLAYLVVQTTAFANTDHAKFGAIWKNTARAHATVHGQEDVAMIYGGADITRRAQIVT